MFFKIIFMKITGMVKVKLEGFFIERFLNLCKNEGIILESLSRQNSTYIRFKILKSDFKRIKKIARKTKCRVKIEEKIGLPFLINKYKKRKVFAVALGVIAFFIMVASNFIWEININGLEFIAKEDLLKMLDDKGVKIGRIKYGLNVEKIENEIKIERKDIAWIGINFDGTSVNVNIKEALEIPEVLDESISTNIIANEDAIIEKIVVRSGTARVKVGDNVKKGDILIEGVMEGVYKGVRDVHADGIVLGKIFYEKELKENYLQKNKVKTGNIEKKKILNFKKNKINFNKGLSKFEKYDTIRTNSKIRLFSNFYFPVEIENVIFEEYYLEDRVYSEEELKNKLIDQLERELEMAYKVSQYDEEHKRRDVVVNKNNERFISQINIRSSN